MTYLLKYSISYVKKCLIVFITSFFILSVFNTKSIHGDDVTYIEAPWVYLIENDAVTIIAYVGNDEECQIPWTLGGLEIKYIKKIGNDAVKKVIVPNNDVGIDPSVSEEYEVLFYDINENGESIINEYSETSSPISNFFSNLFGSKKNKDTKETDDSSSKIVSSPNDVVNNDSAKSNNNNKNNVDNDNNNKDTANNNIPPITNKSETITDPFEIQDNFTDTIGSNFSENIKSNYIYVIIFAVIVIILIVYLISRKQSNRVGISRFIRLTKRKFRRFFNKFK